MYLDIASQAFLSILFGGGAAGVLIYLTRTWLSERIKSAIKAEYDEKLETHKVKIRAASDVEIERLKSQLSIAATERQIQFSRLHEERAKVIAETYRLLKDVHIKLTEYVSVAEWSAGPSKADRRGAIASAYNSFIEHYNAKKIFIPEATARRLDGIARSIRDAYHTFFFTVETAKGGPDHEGWIKIDKDVNESISQALEELEREFRELLGDKRSP